MFSSDILLDWYCDHKRILPWRETSNPYFIWISEIILQQTRVIQGMNYYLRFIERFPSVYELAEAPEDEVLKLWQGLGYYSRARNLHAAARIIVYERNGAMPSSYKEWLEMPGVGKYTAAAISSIAFGEAVPVIDGNVKRLISRLFVLEYPIQSSQLEKAIGDILNEKISRESPGDFNQAIMELGATICTVKPLCPECPLEPICQAKIFNRVSDFPVSLPKKEIKDRYFNYFFVRYKNFTYLKKRGKGDIWQGLYEFPLVETDKEMSWNNIKNTDIVQEMCIKDESSVRKVRVSPHILSHQRIISAVFILELKQHPDGLIERGYKKVDLKKIESFPVSRLIEKFLDSYQIFN